MPLVLQKARKPLIWSDLLWCRGLPSLPRHFPSFFYILGIQYRPPTRYRFSPHTENEKMGVRFATPDKIRETSYRAGRQVLRGIKYTLKI